MAPSQTGLLAGIRCEAAVCETRVSQLLRSNGTQLQCSEVLGSLFPVLSVYTSKQKRELAAFGLL